MRESTIHLQFLLVATLSLLALAAAGTVLLIKALERREAAAERPRPGLAQARWRSRMQVWLRRYAIAAAVLAALLAMYGAIVYAGG